MQSNRSIAKVNKPSKLAQSGEREKTKKLEKAKKWNRNSKRDLFN